MGSSSSRVALPPPKSSRKVWPKASFEAALDDSNVVRFAHYMRNMSAKTQFIVINKNEL